MGPDLPLLSLLLVAPQIDDPLEILLLCSSPLCSSSLLCCPAGEEGGEMIAVT